MDDRSIDVMVRRLDRLDRQNRRLRWTFCALLAASAAIGFGRIGPAEMARAQPPAPQDERPGDAEALVRERLAMSQKALDIIMKSWSRGAPVLNPTGDMYRWSSRLLGSQIYLGMAPGEPRVEDAEVYLSLTGVKPTPDRIAAFRAHRERMKAWEDRLRPLARSGVLSTLDFLEVQSRRIQAEVWLAREQAK